MKHKILKSLLATMALGLTSGAFADGFSASVDAPVFQGNQFNFSIGGSLNYSIEVMPRLFVGASVNPQFIFDSAANPVFSLSARVGAKYVLSIVKTSSLYVDVPIGVGVDVGILQAFTVAADVNAGINVNYVVAPNLKVLAAAYGKLGYNFTASSLGYGAGGTVGLFFEPVRNIELFARGEAGIAGNFSGGASPANYSIIGGAYYTFVPQFKLGLYVGYNNSFANAFTNGGFVVGLRGLFVMKPGSLGVEGAFKP
jgi:hypothetical protein